MDVFIHMEDVWSPSESSASSYWFNILSGDKISNEETNKVTPKEYACFVFDVWECKHSMWAGLYILQLSVCVYMQLFFEVQAISILKIA